MPHKPPAKKSPDPTTSMVYSFNTAQIDAHIKSLTKPTPLKPMVIRHKCTPVLKRLMDSEFGWIFNVPVDPVELNLPDYFDVVKRPMDLGSIKKRLENQVYRDTNEFTDEVRLTFDNAILYNGPTSDVTEVAKKMKKMFDADWKRVQIELAKDEEAKRNSGEQCALCGKGQLLYEPTSYYCNGAACNGQRIRRNSYYYCDTRNKYHWCHVCFGDLKEGQTLEMADATLRKEELVKKKNDETHDEPWVGCDECPRWVHQICALFNCRKNVGDVTYHCPFCVQQSRLKLKQDEGTVKIRGAKEIGHTRASAFIEKRVRAKVAAEQKRLMEEEGVPPEKIEQTGALFVRQLSNLKDKAHQVKPRVYERYKDSPTNFPMEFPVTSKCICLFEEIEGVDVMLFGMYLYEYGHKCPQPNHRRVYVSYLDSVQYFRPRQYRTLVYHEMLVAYLAYAKARGFHTCHIWACPPLKGDDYIFFCHPEEQKTPKEDRLRNWYITMLQKCQNEGTVCKLTTLYDEHFKSADSKATDVPYFEGDHWNLEAEAILKALEDEKEQRAGDKDGKRKGKKASKDKKAKTGRGLRSDGNVEELNGRDPLVVRMCESLEKMKDAFIVAHLNTREFAKEKWEQRVREMAEEEAAEKAASEGKPALKADPKAGAAGTNKVAPAPISSADQPAAAPGSSGAAAAAATPANGSETKPEVKAQVKVEGEAKLEAVNGTSAAAPQPPGSSQAPAPQASAQSAGSGAAPVASAEAVSSTPAAGATAASGGEAPAAATPAPPSSGAEVGQKPKEAAEGAKPVEGGPPPPGSAAPAAAPAAPGSAPAAPVSGAAAPAAPSSVAAPASGSTAPGSSSSPSPPPGGAEDERYPSYAPPADELEDMDEQLESDFFDTRQQFLNLCQGNHYQFDLLRRAKHTSMMALYHIHNPDIPKFLTTCTTCQQDINSGYRYDCDHCPEFHLCHQCYQTFQLNRRSPHEHRLKKVAVQSESTGQLTEEQRRQRQRSIQLHMQLLAHASICRNPECPSANCEKMKNLLQHGTKCTTKVQGGCNVCRRIWALLQIHARQCRRPMCQVPKCRQLKEQLRSLQLQQAAMDERRRLAMHEQYSQRQSETS
mmetsp:Transcript_10114/g.23330  ORF Transcript_10114/g.23330 Transcript_10114/m.23330 type:complete len:1106 (-) Transcript_10114:153-3470(-)